MRILIATDGSPHTEDTLRLGAQLARRADEPPTVLTVIKHMADCPSVSADAILARARKLLEAQVSSVRTKVRVGSPVEEIIREAQEGNYGLLIVGQRRARNRMTLCLLGSTAMRVAARAPCPVIVAKGQVGPIRRILLCDSGVESPSVLSRFTARLADLLEGEEEVTILHVMSQMSAGPGVSGKQLRASVEELIKEHAPEGELLEQGLQVLKRPGIHPHPKVRHGLVVDEILQDAQSGDYDLVVIGAHRGERWQRILLDDLASKILARLDRPVLVVR